VSTTGRIAGLAFGVGLGAVLGIAGCIAGCAGRKAETLSAERLDQDRVAREAVLEAIDRDHAALAALITTDRFEQPESIYSDPELRALALHLIEQTRQLRRLAESDVLAPGAP
jgi:hypothetical protein